MYQSRSVVRQKLRFIIIPLSYRINPTESHCSLRAPDTCVDCFFLFFSHLQLWGVWQCVAYPSNLMRCEIAADLLGTSMHTHIYTRTYIYSTSPPTTCLIEAIGKDLQDHKRYTAGVDMHSPNKLYLPGVLSHSSMWLRSCGLPVKSFSKKLTRIRTSSYRNSSALGASGTDVIQWENGCCPIKMCLKHTQNSRTHWKRSELWGNSNF